jgi:hypothetical protein
VEFLSLRKDIAGHNRTCLLGLRLDPQSMTQTKKILYNPAWFWEMSDSSCVDGLIEIYPDSTSGLKILTAAEQPALGSASHWEVQMGRF